MFLFNAIYIFGFIKIIGSPVFDELFLALLFFKSKFCYKIEARSIILVVFLGYFLLMGFVGFFAEFNVNAIRYSLLFLTLMVYVFINYFRCFSLSPKFYFSFSVLVSLLPLFSFELGVAWWQNFFVGTAYSSYLFFVGGVIVSLKNHKYSKFVLLLLMAQSILFDSRLTVVYVVIFTLLMVIRNPKLGVKYVLVFLGGVLSFALISSVMPRVVSVHAINFDIFIAITSLLDGVLENPTGRMLQILNMELLLKQDIIGLLFGSGVTSHQSGLVEIGFASDSTGVIRPIGLPAIVYDFGLLGLVILIMIPIIGFFGSNFDSIALEGLIVISVSLFTCFFVTNLIESVVFWLVILGGAYRKDDTCIISR